MKWLNRVVGKVEFGTKNWVMRRVFMRVEIQQKRLLESMGDKKPTVDTPHTFPPRVAQIAARLQTKGAIKARLMELCEQEGSPTRGVIKWFDELFYDVIWLWWELEK